MRKKRNSESQRKKLPKPKRKRRKLRLWNLKSSLKMESRCRRPWKRTLSLLAK